MPGSDSRWAVAASSSRLRRKLGSSSPAAAAAATPRIRSSFAGPEARELVQRGQSEAGPGNATASSPPNLHPRAELRRPAPPSPDPPGLLHRRRAGRARPRRRPRTACRSTPGRGRPASASSRPATGSRSADLGQPARCRRRATGSAPRDASTRRRRAGQRRSRRRPSRPRCARGAAPPTSPPSSVSAADEGAVERERPAGLKRDPHSRRSPRRRGSAATRTGSSQTTHESRPTVIPSTFTSSNVPCSNVLTSSAASNRLISRSMAGEPRRRPGPGPGRRRSARPSTP